MENQSMDQTHKLPVFSTIANWVRSKVAAPAHAAVDAAVKSVDRELAGFVRFGNRTAYELDEEAFASAKMEQDVDGAMVFNYSTMKGRRATDIIREAAWYITGFIYPDTVGKDGKAKVARSERTKLLDSLGLKKSKGQRRWDFNDTDGLIALVDRLVAEDLVGTEEKPKSTKFSVAFLSPANLNGMTFYYNAPRKPAETNSRYNDLIVTYNRDVARIAHLVRQGWTFVKTDDQIAADTDLTQLYVDVTDVNTKIERAA